MANNLNKVATLGALEKLAKRAKETFLGKEAASGFAGKASGAVNGHLAALDAGGNLTDSGKAASDFVGSVTGGEQGKIRVDGKDVTVCEIASDTEADAMLGEVFAD